MPSRPPPKVSRYYARTLAARLELFSWWRETMRQHPGGLVPVGQAARMLRVTRAQMNRLVASNRFTIVTMPGGAAKLDRFIPVDQLMRAPTSLTRGRPLVVDLVSGTTRRDLGETHGWRPEDP